MTTLLRIDCSPRTTDSHSRLLADCFEELWKAANPEGNVQYRDLAKMQIPHLENATIEGFYTPREHMSKEAQRATAISDELVKELISANEILISSPLYNYNVPSNLKAYLDQVVRIGYSININENGFYGLLTDKTAHLITAKGGLYKGSSKEALDFQEPYLKAILAYMGIKTENAFSLEGKSDKGLVEQNTRLVRSKMESTFKKQH